MTSSKHNSPSITELRDALEQCNAVIEEGIELHRSTSYKFDLQKHEAFQAAYDSITAVKKYIDNLDKNINTQPLFRILEEWRNNYEGATNVLLGHSKPNLEVGGKPKVSSANEYNALLVAAINVLQSMDFKLNAAIEKVAHDTKLKEKDLRNLRTRFSRKDGAKNEFKNLAHRLSKAPDKYEKDMYYQTLVKQFQQLK